MQLKIRRILCALLLTLLCASMSACAPDLGDFLSEDEYCSFFGEFRLFDKDFTCSTYGIGDFYYEEISEEFIAGMDLDTYSYLAVAVKYEMSIEEMYLYIAGDTEGTLAVDVTVLNRVPTVFTKYDQDPDEMQKDPEEGEEEDEEGEEKVKPDDYYLVDVSSTLSISESFNSVGFKFTSGKLVSDGYYIIFRFRNNTAYGRKEGLNPLNIKMTGLFVRCLKPQGN